jgi:ABC-2 type transport system ATP-binding protein
MTVAIEVKQIHKRFGALHVLGGVDLEINAANSLLCLAS